MNLSTDSNEFFSDNQPSPPDSIKKRLNMHVKRRLLEQATTCLPVPMHHSPQAMPVSSPTAPAHTNQLSPPTPVPKEPRKYKTKKQQQQQSRGDAPPESPKKKNARKSVSVIKRTQDAQNDEPHDEDFHAERHLSDGEQSPSAHGASGSIDGSGEAKGPHHTPDILSMVLNEKKAALMNDPAIISFLQGISTKLVQQHQQQQQNSQQRGSFNR